MTDDERFALIISIVGANEVMPVRDKRLPPDIPMSAGYTAGVPRLGIPPLLMTDASLGITNPGFRPCDTATALPAALALGASFNPQLAREVGVMLGREARSQGFNVLLGGGMNLVRDPRNGRNFEYLSEDPLLTAILASEAVLGTQSEGVISTVKHFTLNSNEVNRHWLDAIIDPAAHRESDLLAFEMAIERAQPGAVMSAYNKINGVYASGHDELLNALLKKTWGYPGWVMSDWGAVHRWEYASSGLDQESGIQFDAMMNGKEWFTEPLREALRQGKFPKERLSEMVRRILRSIYAVGLDQPKQKPVIDEKRHNELALEVARQGIVLLKNDGILPIAANKTLRIAVIGGHAHVGVPSGTGSSAVTPRGGHAATIKIGGAGIMGSSRNLYLLPGSPLEALKTFLPKAHIEFDPGMVPAESAALARRSDIAIVFGIRVEGEGYDQFDLSLPWGQNEIISAVAAANANTVVVLETGNPSSMPWHNEVKAIVQAWYPGQAGGTAIAEILVGKINPSGRLPMTFPSDLSETPRPELPGLGTPWGTPTTIHYNEGAEVGYRWFAQKNHAPLYAFGHGLSYTTFAQSDFKVTGGETITASFKVTNTGDCEGTDVPQLYLASAAGEKRMRLLGFERVHLKPGESRVVHITADPRLLARFDPTIEGWRIVEGTYQLMLGTSAIAPSAVAQTTLKGTVFGR
jgi:beta-glucosidase